MKRLLVEGWRRNTHSFALVNQQQCLQLLDRAGLEIYHRDLPYFFKDQRAGKGVLTPEQEARLRAIPAPPADLRFDALLRVGLPYDFRDRPEAGRTFVYGVNEFKRITGYVLAEKQPVREVLARAEATVLVPSRWAAQGFTDFALPPDRLKLVPHGVDTALFRPLPPAERAALRKRNGLEGCFVVLNVGSIAPYKGIDLLLNAVRETSAKQPGMKLLLKGSDVMHDSKKRLRGILSRMPKTHARQVAPLITYIGAEFSAASLARLYQVADVYVAPYAGEGFNLPVLEAIASGLPVICTAGGATDDFVHPDFALRIESREVPVQDGRGLLVDKAHLAALLAQAAEDTAFRERASAAGPAWASERHTWRHAVDRLVETMFPEGL